MWMNRLSSIQKGALLPAGAEVVEDPLTTCTMAGGCSAGPCGEDRPVAVEDAFPSLGEVAYPVLAVDESQVEGCVQEAVSSATLRLPLGRVARPSLFPPLGRRRTCAGRHSPSVVEAEDRSPGSGDGRRTISSSSGCPGTSARGCSPLCRSSPPRGVAGRKPARSPSALPPPSPSPPIQASRRRAAAPGSRRACPTSPGGR